MRLEIITELDEIKCLVWSETAEFKTSKKFIAISGLKPINNLSF
ncbi:hypothetical protein CLERM_404 [Coxiella-like endosymbiont]|nr:hypothetical protein CLERM_404 [Coxiella-like endosymbiont]